MNQHTAYSLALAACLLLPTMGHAELSYPPVNVYAGVGLVNSRYNTNDKQLSATFDTGGTATYDSSNSSMAMFAGYRFDTYLALQLSYSDIGEIIQNDAALKQSLFGTDVVNISAVMTYPVTAGLGIFGKLGAFSWELDIADPADYSTSGAGISYGAGLDYNLYGSNQRHLRLEWDHYDFNEIFIDSVDTATLSLVFQF